MTSLIARIKRWFRPESTGWIEPLEPWPRTKMSGEELEPMMSQPSIFLQALVEREKKGPKMGTFQVFKDKSGQWRWRLRAANSRVLCQSEAYTRKYDAKRSLEAIDRALTPGHRVEWPE